MIYSYTSLHIFIHSSKCENLNVYRLGFCFTIVVFDSAAVCHESELNVLAQTAEEVTANVTFDKVSLKVALLVDCFKVG